MIFNTIKEIVKLIKFNLFEYVEYIFIKLIYTIESTLDDCALCYNTLFIC